MKENIILGILLILVVVLLFIRSSSGYTWTTQRSNTAPCPVGMLRNGNSCVGTCPDPTRPNGSGSCTPLMWGNYWSGANGTFTQTPCPPGMAAGYGTPADYVTCKAMKPGAPIGGPVGSGWMSVGCSGSYIVTSETSCSTVCGTPATPKQYTYAWSTSRPAIGGGAACPSATSTSSGMCPSTSACPVTSTVVDCNALPSWPWSGPTGTAATTATASITGNSSYLFYLLAWQLRGQLQNAGYYQNLIANVNNVLPSSFSRIDTTLPTQITNAINASITAESSTTTTLTAKKAAMATVWNLLANLYNSFLGIELLSGANTTVAGVCSISNTFLPVHNALVAATTAMNPAANAAWALYNASRARI